MLPLVLAYNTGRILSYTVVGTLMGSMGYLATHLVAVNQVQRALQVLASLFMIALGLYLGGWWGGPVRLEQLGTIFWRHLQPLGRRLLPVHAPPQAFLLGMLWGWLPCGLVYSVLIWTIATGSAVQGGLLMLSFGLGTLPTLLAVGVFYAWLSTALRKVWVRRGAGMLVMIFGIYRLLLGAAV
jgi:sulfite exporter TauE/SafE